MRRIKSDSADAIQNFVDLLGGVGSRWGLPEQACRVHAYLYVTDKPADNNDISSAIGIDAKIVSDAIDFLADYRMIQPHENGRWATRSDPWDVLMAGLDERRKRELPNALDVLRSCLQQATANTGNGTTIRKQISKMLELVEDLAAIDKQAMRLAPQTLRRFVRLTGRAARFLDRPIN